MRSREILKGLAAATGLALGSQSLDAHAASGTGAKPITTVQVVAGTDRFAQDWGLHSGKTAKADYWDLDGRNLAPARRVRAS